MSAGGLSYSVVTTTYGGISDPNYVISNVIWVSPTGSDSNTGATSLVPRLFSTATLAMLRAGTAIRALPGTYMLSGNNGKILNGGNADSLTGYAAIISDTPRAAKFVPNPSSSTFNLLEIIAGTANYLILDGLDIQGPLPSFTGGSAIEIKNGHHYKILNCALHDAAAAGLQTGGVDYLLLQGCDIYNNAGTGNGQISGGGYSGVSLLQPVAFDTASGLHTVVRFNRIWNNMEGSTVTVVHSDGNGFILDGWGVLGYSQPTLIEGNLVVGNGARGIEVLNAYNGGVTIRNNTCYFNGLDPAKQGTRGEIGLYNSIHTTVVNNIMVSDPAFNSGNVSLLIINDLNTTALDNNLTFNGTVGQASYQSAQSTTTFTTANGNQPGVNPILLQPTTDVSGDFHLSPLSPASNAGTSAFGVSETTIDGMPRIIGGSIDIGAYESIRAWPDATNTGYGSTVLTTASSNNITTAGTYTGLHFTGTVTISASNVTLQNCLITANNSDQWSLGFSGTLTNILVKNVTIIGAGTGTTILGAAYGFYANGNQGVTFDSCDISQIGQNAINNGNVLVKNCYIHNLNSWSGTHYETIYYGGDGASNPNFSLNLQHNTLINEHNQTASVYIENFFGAVKNVTVNNNKLIGGDFTIYVEGNQNPNNITNVTVTNNAMGAGIFGYGHYDVGLAPVYQVVHTGNYDWITFVPVT